MISEWTVALPWRLKKRVEHEIISQNINLRTAVVEALDLWIKSPIHKRKYLSENSEPELDLGQETLLEVDVDKQCLFVDRDCLKDTCVGWHSNNCIIYLLEQAIVKETITENTQKEKIRDLPSIIDSDSALDGTNLDEVMNKIHKTIIQQALIKHKGSKTKAAQLLNISFDSLRYRMEKLHLEDYGKSGIK